MSGWSRRRKVNVAILLIALIASAYALYEYRRMSTRALLVISGPGGYEGARVLIDGSQRATLPGGDVAFALVTSGMHTIHLVKDGKARIGGGLYCAGGTAYDVDVRCEPNGICEAHVIEDRELTAHELAAARIRLRL